MMARSLIKIGKDASLDEFLDLISQTDEFQHFLLATSHFIHGEPHLEICNVSEFVDDSLVPLATKTLEYATNLAANYEGQTPYDLFSTTLRATVRLPEEKRGPYIDWFNDLVNTASKDGNRKKLFPRLVDELLRPRVGHYAAKFESLSKQGDDDNRGDYKSLVHKLRKDVEAFLTYAQQKIETSDENLDYDQCFNVKGNDKQVKKSATKAQSRHDGDGQLTELDVLSAVSCGDHSRLVKHYGVCALKHHGRKGPGGKTITLYFSNGSGEQTLAIRYDKRLPAQHIDFFRALCEAVTPPNNDLLVLTGKTKRFLADY